MTFGETNGILDKTPRNDNILQQLYNFIKAAT